MPTRLGGRAARSRLRNCRDAQRRGRGEEVILGIAAPNTWSITQACCTKRLVGTVSGIQNFGGNVAGIIAPWLTGAIAHRTGSFASAFVVCGFILMAGALAHWLLMNEQVGSREEA